jgi:heme-degrading monooxygenase HmoA
MAGRLGEVRRQAARIVPVMARFHLAQLNVARAVAPLDDDQMADFMNRLDEVNALAERSPGFVWRLKSDIGNATDIKVTDDPLFIINMSVWESIDHLHAFVYRSDHKDVFARRFEWFERSQGPSMVLWWHPLGVEPTAEEALERLRILTERGPTHQAFTFKQRFDPPEDVAA